MSKKLNLKDKMEEINERFSLKNKAALANDLLENKLAYTHTHSATSTKKSTPSTPNISKKWMDSKLKHCNFSTN